MLAMLEEAGVKALYNNTFVDVKMKKLSKKETAIEAVVVKNAAGLQAIKGKIFIDGSGTAEVVARSGAPFVRGGGPQPSRWQRTNRIGPFQVDFCGQWAEWISRSE